MPAQDPYRVPERLRARFEQVVQRTDAVAVAHLNDEYADLARRMAAALARKRPSPLGSGQPRTWAAAIVYAVGWVNFLSDPAQDPHMSTADLAKKCGVGESTIAAQFRKIRDALDLRRFDPEWTLPGKLADNPLVWLLQVNGLPMDVRHAPREVQEAAFDAGLIPFIPADGAPGSAGSERKQEPGAGERQQVGARQTRRGSGSRPAPVGDGGGPGGRVYQIKITLSDVRPAIWRRVLVPEDTTLVGLHRVIQASMGWEDYHLWRFEFKGVEYAEPSKEDRGRGTRNARTARLDQLTGPGGVLLYEYDFGDGWEHRVQVEEVLAAEPGREYPVYLAGERAGPPEDSGGPLGYARLLEVLADTSAPEHDDMLDWIGEDFDPETVDIEEIRFRLALTRPRANDGGWAPAPGQSLGPGPRNQVESEGGTASLRHEAEAMLRQAEAFVEQFLAGNPDADIEELTAALRSAGFDMLPPFDPGMGGLSPGDVQWLLDADWQGAESAVRLDATLTVDELASSRTLYNARLFLEILAAEGQVKATPKGNLPRVFVSRFRERMKSPKSRWDLPVPGTANEEDVEPLHITRILLELAGLVKRRNGLFSLTRTGEKLSAEGRAGELFATLFRVHFRRFNLEYLDGAPDVPEFQFSIGYTLFRFGHVGGEWSTPYDLAESIVLPGVGEAPPRSPYGDPMPLIVETRFLRPLEGFGLAEVQEQEWVRGAPGPRDLYRRTPLFERFLSFALPES